VKTVLIIFLSGFAGAVFAQQQNPANRAVFTSPAPQTVVMKPVVTGSPTQADNIEPIVFTSPEPTVIKVKPAQGAATQQKRIMFTSPEPQVKKVDDK
jgi:hypothetical protein